MFPTGGDEGGDTGAQDGSSGNLGSQAVPVPTPCPHTASAPDDQQQQQQQPPVSPRLPSPATSDAAAMLTATTPMMSPTTHAEAPSHTDIASMLDAASPQVTPARARLAAARPGFGAATAATPVSIQPMLFPDAPQRLDDHTDVDLFCAIPTSTVSGNIVDMAGVLHDATDNDEDDDDSHVMREHHEFCSASRVAAAPAACTTLLHLSNDTFLAVAAFLPVTDICTLAAVNVTLRASLVKLDSCVWRPRCEALWAGKEVFGLAVEQHRAAPRAPPCECHVHNPVKTLPAAVVPRLVRAAQVASEAEPSVVSRLAHGLMHSWRAAYFLSLRDAKRDFLTNDELFESSWRVSFRKAPESPTGAATFTRIGHANVVQAGAMPPVPCQLYDGGRRVQIDVFPAHRVVRTDSWGWRIDNYFVQFESVDDLDAAQRTADAQFDAVAAQLSSNDSSSSSSDAATSASSSPLMPAALVPVHGPTPALVHVASACVSQRPA